MSTSSCSTVKRCASSFARSSTSPTSRSSRSASAAITVERGRPQLVVRDDALAQRADVAADRGQRRAQLVRDRHQEVALELLGLAEPRGHLAEAVGELADLAGAAARHLDVVVARARPRPRPPRAASTGVVIRRDEYQANAAATSTPPANAISSRSISASQRWSSDRLGLRDDDRAEDAACRPAAAAPPRAASLSSPAAGRRTWSGRSAPDRALGRRRSSAAAA